MTREGSQPVKFSDDLTALVVKGGGCEKRTSLLSHCRVWFAHL